MKSQTTFIDLSFQLLLHHVIPGAFDIGSLQDEMTGVSLAGTQLRVNQYDMHDVEWNEVRVTTINGARVLEDKKDIHIPQVTEFLIEIMIQIVDEATNYFNIKDDLRLTALFFVSSRV